MAEVHGNRTHPPARHRCTGFEVHKGRKHGSSKTLVFPCNSFIINGFPVFLVSVGIGKNRSHSDHPGHKIDIKTKKHSFSPETPIPPDLLRVPSTPPVYISLPYKIDFPKHLGPGDRPGSRSIPRSSSLAWA